MERLLCVKIASRGDLVLAAPAFRALRHARPDAQIDLLVGETCVDVAEHLPFFDRIRTIDDRALFASGLGGRIRASAKLFRMMRDRGDGEGGYTEVLIFHRDWRYAMLARAARIPVRRGFDAGKGARFLTHPHRMGEREHHVSQYAGMAGVSLRAGGPVWTFHAGERESALDYAGRSGLSLDGRPIAALGFGGGNNVKTQTKLKSWPVTSYVGLADRLTEAGYQVAWVGDGADAALLPPRIPGVNLAGLLTVPQTAAVLSACALIVSNDTLTLHLADSLGVPCVGVFGPTDPGQYAPQGPQSAFVWLGADLPCSPCHRNEGFPPCAFDHRCMTAVSVDMVMNAVARGASRTGDRNTAAASVGGT